jgi:hypothetical protein
MSNTIQIKRSSTAAAVPTSGNLAVGELALNLADKKLYTKDASNNIVQPIVNAVNSFTAAQRGTVVALTDGTTITPDFALGNNFSVTLGGNRTLANPTNLTAGQSGVIVVTQDATGSRTLTYGSNFKFAGGTSTALSTAANSVDYLCYYVESATRVFISYVKGVA